MIQVRTFPLNDTTSGAPLHPEAPHILAPRAPRALAPKAPHVSTLGSTSCPDPWAISGINPWGTFCPSL